MTSTTPAMYRDISDYTAKAYADGLAYGIAYGLRPGPGAPKYADGYTGAVIVGPGESGNKKLAAYSAYCEGYGEGCRQHAAARSN